MTETITLFHGTTTDSARLLEQNGWVPHSFPLGNHCGNPGLLYLTTTIENAMWYAQEKGDDAVVAVEIEVSALIVDPEDGIGDTVQEEFEKSSRSGMPANFATRRPIPAERFAIVSTPAPTL